MAETILLVDDEEGIRKVLGISLQDAGYEVLTAASGEEALNMFRTQKPALVLTDIKMPGMDGIELLQKIKQESADTEVIMLTGHGDLDLAIKSLQCEAADFVTKPISDEALEIALKRAHDRMWMRRKLREYTESLEALVYEKTRQLVQSERLAAIGQTIATLAHAIKNIIGGLTGGMFVLEKGMELSNEEYRAQGWEMLKGNVAKIKNLSLGLLNYAKDREPDFELCDPNNPVREVFNLMLPRAKDVGVKLKMELAEDLNYTLLDAEGIHSCLLNLVTNAIDACADFECVTRTLEVVIRSLNVDGWTVEYQVEDNGCGMDAETRKQVFNNFFSTKGSKGTGLGLMITRKVITEHGGEIELTSEKGKGSIFSIRLPKKYDIAASRID
jgi:signal transduction histidine kinase